jgi:dihydrofolate reductase
MPDVRLIAAIGKSGQLGLNGKLPWGREIGDLTWFREQTIGHAVLMGRRTFESVGRLLGRSIWIWDGEPPSEVMAIVFANLIGDETLFIAGGARTYAAFAPFCTKFIVSRVDYDGPADAWFDPAWLIAGAWRPQRFGEVHNETARRGADTPIYEELKR